MESKRLVFKEISEEDTDIIVEWRSDYDAYKYFLSPHKLTREEHLDWYNNKYLFNNHRIDYIAIEKENKVKIGVFGIIHDGDTVEVNYLVAKNERGKGYAFEAVEYLIKYAKNFWGIKTARLEIHEKNIPSLSLARKLHFETTKREKGIIVLEKSV